MVNAIFVCSLSATFFVENLSQFAPFLSVLISVVCNHDAMLVWGEVVLRWFVMECKDALSGLTLEVGVDEVATLSLGFAELYR